MPIPKSKSAKGFQLPEVETGCWRGTRFGTCTVNFGQVVQPGPPRQSVEFTYLIFPLEMSAPVSGFVWPGIVMILTPTPMKTKFPDAGTLFRSENSPSLHLNLQVTRAQFSDMLSTFKEERLTDFHFTLEEPINGSWPIYSWGVGTTLSKQAVSGVNPAS